MKFFHPTRAFLVPIIILSATFALPASALAQTSNSTSAINAQIQALESQLNALKAVANTYGNYNASPNINVTEGPQPLFQNPNSVTLNIAANSSAQALSQCELYQKQNPNESVNCLWQGTLIGNIPGNNSAITAPYQSWVNDWQSNNFNSVTYANAWGNCQATIANNPGAAVSCEWNNQTLYSQSGTYQNVSPIAAPTNPQGAVGQADCSAITGYAFDPNVPVSSVTVAIYENGPIGSGTFLTSTTANILRGDINSEFNITGSHGFSIATPSSLSDGKTHILYVYAENASPASNSALSQLLGSPVSITCAVSQISYPSATGYPSYYYSQYGPLYSNYPYNSSTVWTNGYNYNNYYSQPWY